MASGSNLSAEDIEWDDDEEEEESVSSMDITPSNNSESVYEVGILGMPPEIIQCVCETLGAKDIMSLTMTCRRFRKLTAPARPELSKMFRTSGPPISLPKQKFERLSIQMANERKRRQKEAKEANRIAKLPVPGTTFEFYKKHGMLKKLPDVLPELDE